MDLLSGKMLLDQSGKLHHSRDVVIGNRVIIYYFGPTWSTNCPRSMAVLESLKALYREAKRRNWTVEVIFVSQDYSEYDLVKTFSLQGPWFAVPFDDVLRWELPWIYYVTSLPHITVVNADGVIISHTGRIELEKKVVGIHPTLDYWYNLL